MTTESNFLHDSAKVILSTENYVIYQGSVLMHRRSHIKTSPGSLIGPGGRMDEGDDVISCAVREVLEETGLKLDPRSVELKVVAMHRYPAEGTVWVVFITRIALTAAPSPLSHSEEGTNEWINIADLKNQDKVFPGGAYYHEHVLTPHPGIMYTNLEWENGQVKRVLSSTTVSVPWS